jgi:excisionase family DNA binding protein
MKPDRSLAPPTRLDHPSRGWRDAAPKGATGARTGTRETIADEDRLDGADAPRHDHDLGTENTSAVNRVTNTRLTVTVSQAAELLGISRALAYELIARDELPAIRLGHRIVVPTQRLLDIVLDSENDKRYRTDR